MLPTPRIPIKNSFGANRLRIRCLASHRATTYGGDGSRGDDPAAMFRALHAISPPATDRVMLGAGGAVRYSICDTTVHDGLNADGGKFGYLD